MICQVRECMKKARQYATVNPKISVIAQTKTAKYKVLKNTR